MNPSPPSTMSAGAALVRPLPLLAVALLVLNDHVLKAAAPGFVTGKLSDFAGLLFFPLFLQALFEVGEVVVRDHARPSRRILVGAALLTGLAFSLIQLEPRVAEVYRWGLAALQWPLRALAEGMPWMALRPVAHTADPTDLIALPSLALAVRLGWDRGAAGHAR